MLIRLTALSLLVLGVALAGGSVSPLRQVLDRRGSEVLVLGTAATAQASAYALYWTQGDTRRILINPAKDFPQFVRNLTVGAAFGKSGDVYAVVRHFSQDRTEDAIYRITPTTGKRRFLANLSYWNLSDTRIGLVAYDRRTDRLLFNALTVVNTPRGPAPSTANFALGPLSQGRWTLRRR